VVIDEGLFGRVQHHRGEQVELLEQVVQRQPALVRGGARRPPGGHHHVVRASPAAERAGEGVHHPLRHGNGGSAVRIRRVRYRQWGDEAGLRGPAGPDGDGVATENVGDVGGELRHGSGRGTERQ
jgi:hypothetical protein